MARIRFEFLTITLLMLGIAPTTFGWLISADLTTLTLYLALSCILKNLLACDGDAPASAGFPALVQFDITSTTDCEHF
jgi:hypothetical protein